MVSVERGRKLHAATCTVWGVAEQNHYVRIKWRANQFVPLEAAPSTNIHLKCVIWLLFPCSTLWSCFKSPLDWLNATFNWKIEFSCPRGGWRWIAGSGSLSEVIDTAHWLSVRHNTHMCFLWWFMGLMKTSWYFRVRFHENIIHSSLSYIHINLPAHSMINVRLPWGLISDRLSYRSACW